jgi:hypothetical protein
MSKVTAEAMARRRAHMFAVLQAKPAAYFARTPTADTLARFSSDLAVELEETARLFLRLQGHRTRPLTAEQVADLRDRTMTTGRRQ